MLFNLDSINMDSTPRPMHPHQMASQAVLNLDALAASRSSEGSQSMWQYLVLVAMTILLTRHTPLYYQSTLIVKVTDSFWSSVFGQLTNETATALKGDVDCALHQPLLFICEVHIQSFGKYSTRQRHRHLPLFQQTPT